MPKLAPGKGLSQVLTEEVITFLKEAIDEIDRFYTDEAHDEGPRAVLDQIMEDKRRIWPAGVDEEPCVWQREKDSYGDKVFVQMPFQEGALRVTLVLTKKDELRVDLRYWFDPST
jgi:hypothetical protein